MDSRSHATDPGGGVQEDAGASVEALAARSGAPARADITASSANPSLWKRARSVAFWILLSPIIAAVLIYKALGSIWRGKRSRPWMVAALGVAAALFVIHVAALAALRDLAIQARRAHAPTPIAFVEPERTIAFDPVTISATDAAGTWRGPNDHVVPIVAALDPAYNFVQSADRDGVVLTAQLEDAAPYGRRWLAWWEKAGDAAERWVWTPVGRPVFAAALRLALQFEPLDVPAGARGVVHGRFSDAAPMPMVELGPGRAIADRRIRVLPKPLAIALAPPAARVWTLCTNAGRCARGTRSLGPLAGFLSAQSGRCYRVATADEIAYASATLRAAAGPAWSGGQAGRLVTEDVALVRPDAVRQGDPRKTDVQVAGCSAGAERRVPTVAAALANSGDWGKVTELGHPMPANARGTVTILFDSGHPEEGAVKALVAALARQGFAAADVHVAANAGAPTPWSLSVVLCPVPVPP